MGAETFQTQRSGDAAEDEEAGDEGAAREREIGRAHV